MAWREVAGNWLWIPPQPTAIIHFLGGAFVAAAPYITYKLLLEAIGRQGYIIVATPFVNTFDHQAIAKEVLVTFEQAMHYLETRVLAERLPIYGLGHSMGCKIHVLLNSLYGVERAGNVLMAFNNYSARRSIPLLDQVLNFSPDLTVEFTPSPEETLRLVDRYYTVDRNLLIKFRRDEIDQTRALHDVLNYHFPELTRVEILPGTHTTPLMQEIPWQPGRNFSALDAIGQFVKQEFTRDLNRLQNIILMWLNPLSTARLLGP
ncbi:MAG: DUF1350 domain-containing protein [Leptolyngbya sp. SIO1D8]|nr:DUF1350 domain-containing protein [Leptolyngbya sp. SIO1D8]